MKPAASASGGDSFTSTPVINSFIGRFYPLHPQGLLMYPSCPRYRNVTATTRKRRSPALRPRLPPLPPPRLLAVATAFAFALIFLVLVLLSTSSPAPSPPSHSHHGVVVARSASSSSSAPAPPRCSSSAAAASLGELGDAMVAMLPRDLPFTVFVPSADSFSRVLRLQGPSKSNATSAAAAAAAGGGEAAAIDAESNTYAILSRVLGFSAVPRRLLAADVPPPRLLDSVSGLSLYASRDDARGALVVNGVPSECVDIVRGHTVVHVMAGVLMDAEFERSFSAEFVG